VKTHLCPTYLCAVVVATSVWCAAAGSAPPAFRLTTSLDGLKVLPHRIQWVARTNVPTSTHLKVEFFVDGGVARWAERDIPYTFSDDDGYLVTSWLTPGQHRFTVRATIVRKGTKLIENGPFVERTVVARVMPAAIVPSALRGTWQRRVDVAGSTFPPGIYKITFDKRWIQDHFPGKFNPVLSHNNGPGTGKGLIQDNDWIPGETTFQVQGAVVYKRFNRADPEGGAYCNYGGPPATYAWTITGGTLTLAPVGGRDPCRPRGRVWSGNWTRTR
jgi:hypothetical protein